MVICYFGIYKPDYSRNKILLSGLKSNGVEILECRTDKNGIFKYFDLIKKHWQIRNDYDAMFVAYPGFQPVILAKFLTSKPIIFDAFVSMYDSMVSDRKKVSKKSLKAKYFWWLDKLSMTAASLVLIDTNEHKKYLATEFSIKENKIKRVFLGADTGVFFPRGKIAKNDKFKVLFYGTYIPLQGIEYIVRSAKILEREKDIEFELIGDGQEKNNILELAEELEIKNIDFKNNISINELAERISQADVCLGIFGNTEKARRVIPNKVYECVAMNRPVITADTRAIRELFGGNELFLVDISNPRKIAEAVLKVKFDIKSAALVSNQAYNKFKKNVLPKQLGAGLKQIIDSVLL